MDSCAQPPVGGVDKEALEDTARAVIQVLKDLRLDARVAVIGGLARIHWHDAKGRITHDVDFLIDDNKINVDSLKATIGLANRFGTDRGGELYYDHLKRDASTIRCFVKLIAQNQVPYIPSDAEHVRDIQGKNIPYISISDLIAFKIYACGKITTLKRVTHAIDAHTLLGANASKEAPLTLTADQKAAVESGIEILLVVWQGDSRDWWTDRLGL
ncbi:hypothetical protein F5144DRAFT_240988 [Chaetomium tenue]|uniref:Uncharacterized protein n=1 Tax=Chaetomium tenue TaxID=1854479 RepID=A0ACB7P9H7_9PEZI|nr:hypothetical protein F5144DRAFT_240988 [Chaetomium globosum]